MVKHQEVSKYYAIDCRYNYINETPNLLLKKLKIRNSNKIIIGSLNINSLLNEFQQLKDTVMIYTDILILIEIRLVDTFPTVQFLVNGFSKPCKLGRNRNGGAVLIYIRENIHTKLLDEHAGLNFG